MMPPGWVCTRRIGFLFPRICARTTPEGCPDCANGQIADPFRQRRSQYGYGYEDDFTEADGESVNRRRRTFEEDASES